MFSDEAGRRVFKSHEVFGVYSIVAYCFDEWNII